MKKFPLDKLRDQEAKDSSWNIPPVYTEEFPADKLPDDLAEYGYGFWIRFLTCYP
jgi:hypothetical protein